MNATDKQRHQRIYLDWNATAPVPPPVVERLRECLELGPLNPSSQHSWGRRARRILEDSREAILRLLDARDLYDLVFTSGGTEANNLALLGLCRPGAGQVVISAIEHPSVKEAAAELKQSGFQVRMVRARPDGQVDLDHLAELLVEPTQLVSIMLANNETGVLQPVAEACKLCHLHGALLHCDIAQAVGKASVHLAELSVDAATVAGHKFGAPVGIGALVVRRGAKLEPQIHGGPQESQRRAGTEPVALAAAMTRALEVTLEGQEVKWARMEKLRRKFEERLREGFPGCIVHGQNSPRTPQTSYVAFPGVDRQALVVALDLEGVACSVGSACASGAAEPSPTLKAMGADPRLVESSVRFSFGPTTTQEELDDAADRIVSVANRLKQ